MLVIFVLKHKAEPMFFGMEYNDLKIKVTKNIN